ncbi:MAG: alanine racemase [Anaerosolibacter sp.]|jgi:predicted amino acid racemase|uniref:ornithine racemase Orr n=1 Tax=Anaerosolibacter sp. TaxID=1872527 RepID=UPI00260D6D36|nr:ornithine racemase Orr [Anaerosolibacter sp.]MDF2545458.1 alanine racemase [Anaerosolibacter sp.]
MAYPKLEINLSKIYHNGKLLVEMCEKKGIEIAGVTKVFRGNPEIAKVLVDAGVSMLADSRIENIKKLKDIEIQKMLIRIPMLSEVEELVEYVDISINSELEVMDKISKEALRRNKVHQIMLMIDLGDLREGLWEDEIDSTVEQVLMMRGIQLAGLGANFGCYGGIVPERHTLEKLINIKQGIEKKYNISIPYLSGGNSNSLHLIWEEQMPEGINHLRIGYPFVLGKEDVYDQVIEGLYGDAFRLYGEIVEIKNKPSVPIGKRGIDAFGNMPEFIDRGIRKKAIVALGRQDVRLEGIMPKDDNVTILGASSDHLILDITDTETIYGLGDIMEFTVNYGALLAAMTSDYVEKEIIK